MTGVGGLPSASGRGWSLDCSPSLKKNQTYESEHDRRNQNEAACAGPLFRLSVSEKKSPGAEITQIQWFSIWTNM
jgi:hypothetical protein